MRLSISACAQTAGLLIATSLAALAQTPAVAPPPDFVLYRALFSQIQASLNASEKLAEKGKSDLKARGYFKEKAGLTDFEDGLLKQTAQSCSADYERELKHGTEIVLRLKSQYQKKGDMPPSAVDQIDRLQAAREKVITDCVARLKSQMGQASFAKVEAYSRQKVAPAIRNVPATSETNVKGGAK